MASSILRKSLQLFEEEPLKEKGISKEKRKRSVKDDTTDDSSKRGVKKRKRKHFISKVKTKLSRESALETYNKTKSMDHTEDSLYYINMISNIGGKPDSKAVTTILEHNRRRSTKSDKKTETKSEQTQSIFSEKDFENFRKEYLNS
ncbi:active regulator of SIRT1-like [Ostrea edulis]|uniref:active regulator of SIRT1-like n=1 Tax=Ostrea edulis TaxID=37623 RepID=UPI0020944CEC|nr:active regulator of SIRT1-like [Ostrea edulis]